MSELFDNLIRTIQDINPINILKSLKSTKQFESLRFLTNRILTINENNITNTSTTSGTSDVENKINLSGDKHPENIGLLVIDLIIFIVLTVVAYMSSKKLTQVKVDYDNEQNQNAAQFKSNFTKGLMIANSDNNSGDTPIAWVNHVAHAFPAFIFLSAYMGLVIIISDIYYSLANYQNLMIKPMLLTIAASSYIIIAILAFYTFELLIGIGYLCIGIAFIYFGEKMADFIKSTKTPESQEENERSQKISFKIFMFSYSIGGLFLFKSLCGILTAFHAFGDLYPVLIGPNVWDFIMFLVTEILPTIIFIVVAKFMKGSQANTNEVEIENVEMEDLRATTKSTNITKSITNSNVNTNANVNVNAYDPPKLPKKF